MKLRALFASLAGSLAAIAQAEVKSAAVDSFVVGHQLSIAAPPKRVFEALGRPGAWWSDAHTWSGHGSNLTLEPTAGGCFCETWSEGSVAHGRVLHVERDKLLRLDAALGPFEEMAISGVLSFALTARDEATLLVMTYRVNGTSGHKLDAIAPVVDGVLGQQMGRLKQFIESGRPE